MLAPGRPLSLRRCAACLGLFLAAVAGGTWAALRAPVLKPQAHQTLDEFEAHREDCTILLAGSSFVQRQLIPSIMNEVSGERVYNLGFPNASYAEIEALLARILVRRPPGLKLVVLEVRPLPAPVGLIESLRDTLRGRGRAMLCDWTGTYERVLLDAGYFDRSKNPVDEIARYARSRYLQYVRERGSHIQTGLLYPDPVEVDREGLERVAGLLKRHGVHVILLKPPVPLDYPEVPGAPALDFSDPAKFPELFSTDVRWDFGHLAQPGAELFSRKLAAALVGLAEAGSGPFALSSAREAEKQEPQP